MILRLLGTRDLTTMILGVLATTFVVFCTLPIHEYAHAWAATRLGDDTARMHGRLTLNPIAHLSPMGTLMIYLLGFGYAKPVPVNARNFENPKRDMALTAFAGPASNLIMAFILMLIWQIINLFAGSDFLFLLRTLVGFAATININLAIFNLLPIPPLDGSKILGLVLPNKYYYMMLQHEQTIYIILIVLLFTGVLTTPLMFFSNIIYKAFSIFTSLPFKLIGG